MVRFPLPLLAASICLSFLAPGVLDAWDPPIGIPMPPFGITQVAGPATVIVQGGGSIPNPVPAGAVVEIRGAYTRNHTGGSRLQCAGTAQNPAYIRGGAANNVTGDWEIVGSYCVIEGLKFGPGGFWTVLGPASFIAVRDNDVSGTLAGEGGLWIQNYTVANVSNIVFLRNVVHNCGDWQANFDQDSHGTGLYRDSAVVGTSATISNIWILDSEYRYNSGDGIQINGNGPTEIGRIHHVYVGRNVAHHNKQSGFWSKEASDVVFSQNEVYEHHPPTDNSASGQGMGFQYGPERVWFLFNKIHDCDYGIQVVSDDSGTGKDAYLIGNLIYRIHGAGSASDPYSPAAIHMRGATRRYLINNTIYDADAGIESPVGYGFMYMVNNIIGAPAKAGGMHIFLEDPGITGASIMHHNLLAGTVRIRWGTGTVYNLPAFQAATGQGLACLNADPLFVDPANGNFRLQSGSPAIDHGSVDPVYALYQGLYGVEIARDAVNLPRPVGLAWDMGAHEFFNTTFVDVPADYWAYAFVEAVYAAGVTGGCSANPPLFCPANAVTRGQMAIFLLRSKEGSAYTPPPCSTPRFTDVPCSNPFAPWINELAARQVTGGCGGSNYCPNSLVTRDQMAIFLLRTLEGPAYLPPACSSPTFTDVPCSSAFAAWIYELVARQVTGGCGNGRYCPTSSVNRAQMSVFLVSMFSIPL